MKPLATLAGVLRDITWRDCAWIGAIALVHGLGRFHSEMNWDAWTDPGDIAKNIFANGLVAGFAFLYAVKLVEHGRRDRVPGWSAYLGALFLGVSMTVLADWLFFCDVPQKYVVVRESWVFSHYLLAGGLGIFIYAHLRWERLALAALAKAELERASISRRVLATRLEAMQAQVEPGFLLNTLGHVEALYERDQATGDGMLDSLIAYLRAALPQLRENVSTVEREARLAQAYLRIVKARMGSRLEFEFDVPSELAARTFPPMVLLPLIDNAIRHGLEPLPHGGTIRVSAMAEGERVQMRVRDDGIADRPDLGDGGGAKLLRDRLLGLYGAKAELAYVSMTPHGVEASVAVPA